MIAVDHEFASRRRIVEPSLCVGNEYEVGKIVGTHEIKDDIALIGVSAAINDIGII